MCEGLRLHSREEELVKHKVIFDIVRDTKFNNDLGFCSEFLHTGRLESFHPMKL